MKFIPSKKFRMTLLHLLFWLISINIWYFVFNPSVESVSIIKGLDEFWLYILLFNSLSFLYCLLPFTWLLKKAPKWLKITGTILFLIPLIYLLFLWLVPTTGQKDFSFFDDFFVSGFLYVLVFHLTIIAAVYYNLKILIPRFLTHSRFGLYFLSFIGLACVAAFLNLVLFDFIIDKLFPNLYFISYFRFWELIIIIAGYLLFTTLLFLVWQYTVMLIANREKAQNELSALKAQINPHFLFNNLNTIYSLASKNDEHTKDVILKLSDFLRYVLYDTISDSIPLDKEVEIIKTYIDLQKERIDQEITPVLFSAEGNFGTSRISPLLLLPFVENCFKHGIGKAPGKIQIDIRCDGNHLLFKTENSMALREKTGNEENGGIGIKNVEKRLNLLYPGRHSIYLEEKEGIFRVELSVDL
jgi:two-component system, LytTR family, sensor kinase